MTEPRSADDLLGRKGTKRPAARAPHGYAGFPAVARGKLTRNKATYSGSDSIVSSAPDSQESLPMLAAVSYRGFASICGAC